MSLGRAGTIGGGPASLRPLIIMKGFRYLWRLSKPIPQTNITLFVTLPLNVIIGPPGRTYWSSNDTCRLSGHNPSSAHFSEAGQYEFGAALLHGDTRPENGPC